MIRGSLPVVTLVVDLSAITFFTAARICVAVAACASLKPVCTCTALETPGKRDVLKLPKNALASVRTERLYAHSLLVRMSMT